MKRKHVSPSKLIKSLGVLSKILNQDIADNVEKFKGSLNLIKDVLKFDLSVLYRVRNVVNDILILEVIEIDDTEKLRKDLYKGLVLKIDLIRPVPEFVNEAMSYKLRGISNINVPGVGSDLMGYVDVPDDIGGGYLFGGDYLGEEAGLNDAEKQTFQVMCNLLGNVEMRSYYKQMAIYDSLTTIYNSRYIRSELVKIYHRFQRHKDHLICVILCDIDFFKKVNDTYGHIQGDYVLKEIGQLLKSQMRQELDVIGRYGGEEFLIIMRDCLPADCFKTVDRWRQVVETHAFQRYDEQGKLMPNKTFHLTMSFGIASLKIGHGESLSVLADADKALYQAKRAGRNQVVVFSES